MPQIGNRSAPTSTQVNLGPKSALGNLKKTWRELFLAPRATGKDLKSGELYSTDISLEFLWPSAIFSRRSETHSAEE